jgi:hypothetical protein
MVDERLDALGQGGIAAARGVDAPMHGRLSGRRHVEVLAQRCGKRHLETGRHLDLIQDRRQAAVAGRHQQLASVSTSVRLTGG